MSRSIGSLLLFVLAGPLASQATLILLGDSFSDGGQTGNIPVATGGVFPGTKLVNEWLSTGQGNAGFYPPPPYYYGRFTNGPVWIEVAASLLGQAVDNFAAGGANAASESRIGVKAPFGFVSTDQFNGAVVHVPNLVAQAQAYAALKAAARGFQDIVVISIGPDEFYQKLAFPELTSPVNTSEITDAVRQALDLTYAIGVRKFVIVDLPPVTSFPFTARNSSISRNDLGSIVDDQNSQFDALAAEFNSSNDGVQVFRYDLAGLFAEVQADPTSEAWSGSFTNTADACREGNLNDVQVSGFSLVYCTNPEEYLWWDVVHPTSHFHSVWGQDFAAQLRPYLKADLIKLSETTSASA